MENKQSLSLQQVFLNLYCSYIREGVQHRHYKVFLLNLAWTRLKYSRTFAKDHYDCFIRRNHSLTHR